MKKVDARSLSPKAQERIRQLAVKAVLAGITCLWQVYGIEIIKQFGFEMRVVLKPARGPRGPSDRKPVFFGDVAVHLWELIREICKSLDIEIIKGHVSKDHVNLFVSVPPQLSTSKVMGRIKVSHFWGHLTSPKQEVKSWL